MAYSPYGSLPLARPRSHMGYGAEAMAYPNQAVYGNACGLWIFHLHCSEFGISTANHPTRFMALHRPLYQGVTV